MQGASVGLPGRPTSPGCTAVPASGTAGQRLWRRFKPWCAGSVRDLQRRFPAAVASLAGCVLAIGALLAAFSGEVLAQAKEVTGISWAQLKTLRGISTSSGSKAPALFIFFDPNCPYCARLWKTKIGERAMPAVPAVWVPIAYMDKTSAGKAAALLRAKNSEGLAANFDQFDEARRSGAMAPVAPTGQEAHDLRRAFDVWKRLGGGTPLMVWRSRKGAVMSHLGLPTEARLAEMVGDVASSSLQRYPDGGAP